MSEQSPREEESPPEPRLIISLDEAIHAQVVAIQTLLHDLPVLLVSRAHQLIAQDQSLLIQRFEHAAQRLQDAFDSEQGKREALRAAVDTAHTELDTMRKKLLLELDREDWWAFIEGMRTQAQTLAQMSERLDALEQRIGALEQRRKPPRPARVDPAP